MMRVSGLIACVGLLLPCHVAAQDADHFYVGKRINIVVGSAAGSGYDAYARLLGRHLAQHIPGNPTITVQNMPGGGGLTAANYIYNAAPKDGTVIGGFQRGLLISPWVMPEGVRYNVGKINWIGSTTSETGVVAVWHTAPQLTVNDLYTEPLIVGGSGPQTDSETTPRAYAKLLGLKFRIVSGYPSTGPVLLAMERGEVQGIGNSSWSNWTTSYSHYLKDKKVRLLLQSGLERNPDIAGVPMALDLAKSPEQRSALELLLAPNKIGRPFGAPPDVPAERIAELRKAFDLTMKDPTFLAEAASQKLDISPVDGLSIERILERFAALPPAVAASARNAIKPD
jgi:tripartite-type tricarboxylate transporter receptor subunit TctC